ncbi:MED14-domain-containing protein [Acaromyces ingoldii]|uniref:Mediator of RNA polymerase II transcription subunit 14 n=1 Tax=Acaromyces ingoldii TaxID=215250 RepID=A0A316YQ65_9BASI|nr:MED14-domain-containing protein [Acaromyces ingoldii]PWN90808.1 MED14-domain-containing protein [Acaromyces ingoldii]
MPSTPTVHQRAQDHHHSTSFVNAAQHNAAAARQGHAGYAKPSPAQGPLGALSPTISTPSNPSIASGGSVVHNSNGANGRTSKGQIAGPANGGGGGGGAVGNSSGDAGGGIVSGAGVGQAKVNGDDGQDRQGGAIAGPGPSTVQAAAAAAAAASSSKTNQFTLHNGVSEGQDAPQDLSQEVYSILYKTRRRRAWEKSRHIDEVMPTREELDEQVRPPLPNPDEQDRDLIPLSAIAQRLVFYAWQLFANQVEINPSLSPMERRKRMFNDAVEARKQLIKLLVLARWCACAEELHLARDIISFINDHIFQTDSAVASLNETRSILTRARLRSFDVVTAIEVLGAGAPQRVPPLIKESIAPQKQYTDDEALEIIEELNEALTVRLACDEAIPVPMLSYTIDDGRACFVVPSLFEADLTLAGVSIEEALWQLTRVKFDFKITGSGADRFPRQPINQQRQVILYLANAELAPKSIAAVPELEASTEQVPAQTATAAVTVETDVEMHDAEDGIPAEFDKPGDTLPFRKDTPLLRLYNFLQSQALNYQLDILHYQAIQLTKLSWGASLAVHMDHTARPRTLSIRYWNQQGAVRTESGQRGEQQRAWTPAASATLKVSVREVQDSSGKGVTVEGLLDVQDDDEERARNQSLTRLEIPVEWEVDGPATPHLRTKDFTIDNRDLDIEKLLLEAVSRHAHAALLAFRSRIQASSLCAAVGSDQCRLRSHMEHRRPTHALVLPLHERLCLVLHLDALSGQLRLEEAQGSGSTTSLSCTSLASHDRSRQLRDASKRLNDRPGQVVSILQNLRCNVILEDLEQKASLLGLPCTRRLPLRQEDYQQLRAHPGTMLFVHLAPFPTYYLVLRVTDDAIRVALICAHTFMEGVMTSMLIYSLVWLDRSRITRSHALSEEAKTLGKRRHGMNVAISRGNPMSLTEEELAKLYSYSLALVSFNKVEQQLQLKNVPFVHVSPASARSGEIDDCDDVQRSVIDLVPSLALRADMLLGPAHTIVKPNLSLKMKQWWDVSKSRVEISARLRVRAGLSNRRISASGGATLDFDPRTSILTFSTQDVDNCISMFLLEWNRVSKVANLAKELLGCHKIDGWSSGFVPTLDKFDLCSVSFEYAKGLSAEVSWREDLRLLKGGFYSIVFSSSLASKNPHEVMAPTLQRSLSRGNDNEPGFWLGFLKLLQNLLPMLEQVSEIDERCLEDVSSPELEVRSATQLRLVFWEQYVLDIELRRGAKVLFSTTTAPSPALEAKVVVDEDRLKRATAIPNFDRIALDVTKAYCEQAEPSSSESSRIVQRLPAVLALERGILSDCTPATARFVLRMLQEKIVEELTAVEAI